MRAAPRMLKTLVDSLVYFPDRELYGDPADVGLAVALAVRLRELLWLLPGLLYLLGRGIAGAALRESVA